LSSFASGFDAAASSPGANSVAFRDPVIDYAAIVTERWRTIRKIDQGEITPDASSRLGAYAATGRHAEGTVGYAVHNSIFCIYLLLGTVGEERIGEVFNSKEARALYDQPVSSSASRSIATIEYNVTPPNAVAPTAFERGHFLIVPVCRFAVLEIVPR
jgi:hypothetical protein